MSEPTGAFRVFEHGPLTKLEDNLYTVEGAVPTAAPLRRVMTVVRLSDGTLAIHSAIALQPAEMQQLESLGRPAYLLVPNAYHRLDARGYKERYPDIQVLCPRGAREGVAKVVTVDGDYASFTPRPELRLFCMEGTGDAEGAMLVRSGDRATLVLNDVLFNMPHVGGVGGFMLRHVTASSGGPRVTRVARLFFIKDKARFRDHLLQLSETEGLCRIIVSHHERIEDDPAFVLRRVADTL